MGVYEITAMLLAMIAHFAQAGVGDPPVTPAGPDGQAAAEPAGPLVPYPHPLITEVLFAVPASGGDANRDGTRSATGDEFIEITNPHEQAISLAGYRLVDRHLGVEGRFSFTFPDLMLKPGQTVVVFNGLDATWTGPVGDTHRAPPGPNPLFEGAFVFTAGVTSRYMALANSADFVLLENALGVPVQVVVWGNPDQAPPREALHTDTIQGTPRSSVQRTGPDKPMAPHDGIDRQTCSPGVAFPKAPVARPEPSESP
ncbi:MAG: lamin tail domain-containing protein [Phycisphaerales bacterium]